jgi:hypothetical protein
VSGWEKLHSFKVAGPAGAWNYRSGRPIAADEDCVLLVLFRFTLKHSIFLVSVVGLLAVVYAYES